MGDRAPDERALEFTYAELNRRERTEAELRRHLEARGLDAIAVDAAVDTLREQDYLNDERYARLFAHDKRDLEQWGSERIRRTLLERGIDRELVEATLSQAPPEGE